MIYLNFATAEEFIFQNEETYGLLPPAFFNYFEQWKMGKRIPALRQVGKRAVLDFINNLQDEHLEALEDYFGERIVIEKLNYNIVQNVKIPLAEEKICEHLCEVTGFSYFSAWRDDEHLYISFWR